MPWESIGTVGNGQMPGERDWILCCYDLALPYLRFKCGEPPPGCQLDVMWHEHDLGEHPSLGVYSESEPPWEYIHRCTAALERFDDAVSWDEIHAGDDFDDDDNSIEDNGESVKTDDPGPESRIIKWDVNEEIDRLFDESSLCKRGSPIAVILMGGVATGKTTLRKQQYSEGYVLIDAADIFLSLSKGESRPFADGFDEPMNVIGLLVAKRALYECRNIVTEIIGAEYELTVKLIEALKHAGYRVEAVCVSCDLEESIKRNANRGDDAISSYYAEAFQRKWLIQACEEFVSAASRGMRPLDEDDGLAGTLSPEQAEPSYTVLVLDMFHYGDTDEEIKVTGFKTLEAAREYARRRTRDSLEALRPETTDANELRDRWFT